MKIASPQTGTLTPARTKGRSKFDFRGRAFVWWIDDDKYLRVASLDKKFVVYFPIGRAITDPPSIVVSGQEFPGLDQTDHRPTRLRIPDVPANSPIGAWVDHILRWCFDPGHVIVKLVEPPQFS